MSNSVHTADPHAVAGPGHHHAHHFQSAEHEFQTCKLGMWIFLVQEILFFSGLFLAYGIFRWMHPEMFFGAHKTLDVTLGATNTVILIFSSLTMALAVRAAQLNQRGQSAVLLVITLLCAFGFLVIKYFEYSHKFHLGMLPGRLYFYDGLTQFRDPHIFFGVYFIMTGLHGIHVIGGIVVIGWILRRTLRGEFSSEYYTPVEMTGLYWHLVDLIWIYLFPLLYLVG